MIPSTAAQRLRAQAAQRILVTDGAFGTMIQGYRLGEAEYRGGLDLSAGRLQVREGLVGLGWSAKEAERAVDVVGEDAGDSPDVAALLRAALRTLSRS